MDQGTEDQVEELLHWGLRTMPEMADQMERTVIITGMAKDLPEKDKAGQRHAHGMELCMREAEAVAVTGIAMAVAAAQAAVATAVKTEQMDKRTRAAEAAAVAVTLMTEARHTQAAALALSASDGKED